MALTTRPGYRLALCATALALLVVLLGAYTRLTHAGLGCPDWPGCYGFLGVPQSEAQLAHAERHFPEAPVEAQKGWNEMVHRYFAGSLGLLIAVLAVIGMWVLMNRTRIGARLYAVGGNIKAANLSGINTKRTLFLAYVICALLASLAGILLTARVESGETNLGGTIALESIAAAVIAGVSLRGGIGRVESVVLGAFFIVLLQNGMNLMQIGSYMQMVLLGSLLVLAVIIDQFRYRMMVGER